MRTCLVFIALVVITGSAAAYTLVDSWNADGVPGSGIYGYPANFAIRYIPAMSFTCARIEFWGSGSDYIVDDHITVRVETEDLEQPSGTVLAEVTTPVTDTPITWIGADFPTPVLLEAGAVYWVIYLPMAWSPVAWANAGDEFPTMSSSDGVHWNPSTARLWMARLWGDPIVATETATWSGVKALFD